MTDTLPQSSQRFITRSTDMFTFELDRSNLSLSISTSGRQFRLNSADIAAMMDLLQHREDQLVQAQFPQIDWSEYTLSFITYHCIALSMITDASLIVASQVDEPADAYSLTVEGYEEKGEALYFPASKRLGIAWHNSTHWAMVNSLEKGIQQYTKTPGWQRRVSCPS